MLDKSDAVLITGGTGSFGKTMLEQLLQRDIKEIRILSRDEEKQDLLRNKLRSSNVRYYIGDIRDYNSVSRAMKGVSCVFHAAALKQVPSCEFFPLEAVKTNILGSENVIKSAISHQVRSIVCLSTDKAVLPINSMGLTKAMMEKFVQAYARSLGPESKTIISMVRYGNVMYSRGSVIPLFINQIKSQKPITITEPKMSRFLMPLSDSVDLVNYAFDHAKQGDLFIRKAVASTVGDLLEAIKQLFRVPNHPVEKIGWRHAEKLYETLATAQELTNSEDMGNFYRIRMDQRDLNYKAYVSAGEHMSVTQNDYHSHNADHLDIEGLKTLLLSLDEIKSELSVWNARKDGSTK